MALAAERHVTLTVRGKVVDSTGKPFEGIVVRCGTQRIDINYSMGLAATEEYITTDAAGEFKTKELTVWKLFLIYGGKKYQEYSASFKNKEQLESVKNKKIFLTIDVDVLDPSVMPGTGTPEANGMTYREFAQWIKYLKDFDIVGADVVELAPDYDKSEVSTAITTKIIRDVLMIM